MGYAKLRKEGSFLVPMDSEMGASSLIVAVMEAAASVTKADILSTFIRRILLP